MYNENYRQSDMDMIIVIPKNDYNVHEALWLYVIFTKCDI